MKYNIDDSAIYEPMDMIIENIKNHMIISGINIKRLYFHSLPVIKINDKVHYIDKIDNIDRITEQLKNNNNDIIFNINGQYSEYIGTFLIYRDLNMVENVPEFNWSEDIKYMII